jgi:SAM-dependent methyltransferase
VTFARTQQIEQLDRPGGGARDNHLAGNLRDIRRANRWFGGTRAVVSAMAPVLHDHNADETLSFLDVATGSADIPIEVASWARREGWQVRIVATDHQPDILAIARASTSAAPITIEQADALDLPYPDNAFDVVALSLALHHFDPGDAQRVLREMARVGRRVLIVNDLERSRLGFAAAWLFGHALTTNPMTRHDAPLSVRRAYTRPEALALAHEAGWHGARARSIVPARYLLTGRPTWSTMRSSSARDRLAPAPRSGWRSVACASR